LENENCKKASQDSDRPVEHQTYKSENHTDTQATECGEEEEEKFYLQLDSEELCFCFKTKMNVFKKSSRSNCRQAV